MPVPHSRRCLNPLDRQLFRIQTISTIQDGRIASKQPLLATPAPAAIKACGQAVPHQISTARRNQPHSLPIDSGATLSTSSIDVRPAKTFSTPLKRKVRIPSRKACLWMLIASQLSTINF